ncbi:hypothetical protein HHK36_023280 [Tetracentron sinense]|uniref:Uncharacterized protein n=1 Tax=Tetracentron sinense TaxID=13715 RepID=A0A834YMU7_TETSI|nr:hypothetical protein HHK36_023280 [Tetracentron sinense]
MTSELFLIGFLATLDLIGFSAILDQVPHVSKDYHEILGWLSDATAEDKYNLKIPTVKRILQEAMKFGEGIFQDVESVLLRPASSAIPK